eukprot:6459339-Amphidinium_carterae.1
MASRLHIGPEVASPLPSLHRLLGVEVVAHRRSQLESGLTDSWPGWYSSCLAMRLVRSHPYVCGNPRGLY